MKSLMNLTMLFFVVASLGSCGGNKDEKPDTIAEEKQETIDQLGSIKTELISVDKGVAMISNGLKEPFLGILGSRLSLGGYFNSSDFKIIDPNVGIILWPCYNPGGKNGHPKLFLVAEQVQKYDSLVDPILNNQPGNNLIMPLEIRKYTNSDVNEPAVKGDVLKRSNLNTTPQYKPIDAATALRYVRNFEELMADYSNRGEPFCKFGQYFFLENTPYENFVNAADIKYVHYYMGFIWDEDHKPNYFRPILTGVKADGTTITSIASSRGDDAFLQKSVPPPPHQ